MKLNVKINKHKSEVAYHSTYVEYLKLQLAYHEAAVEHHTAYLDYADADINVLHVAQDKIEQTYSQYKVATIKRDTMNLKLARATAKYQRDLDSGFTGAHSDDLK